MPENSPVTVGIHEVLAIITEASFGYDPDLRKWGLTISYKALQGSSFFFIPIDRFDAFFPERTRPKDVRSLKGQGLICEEKTNILIPIQMLD